ncbi:Tubby-like F-box protein 8 [Apostasia shenzhenica]|uniref:Tubby-like F-box protein n=1 Tax=Apostasia shenzhenica TaxID=1088818 RepID=A0A2I0BG68_9ASPA|nr:Tubby-like F-box protein 8 [Apostasia shenzhenica]
MSFRSIIRDVRDSIGSLSRRSFELRLSGIHRGKCQSSVHELQDQLADTGQSHWAGLPPELLRDVIRRLEAGESTWPSRKHVVACASVCRSWRKMCKEIVRSPEFCGKLTFPVSLKQPGPRDGTIQCFIKRNKSKMTYNLFLCLSTDHDSVEHDGRTVVAGDEGEAGLDGDGAIVGGRLSVQASNSSAASSNGKLLPGELTRNRRAKRSRRTSFSEYTISMNAGNISKSNATYIGKLRSNFLGTKFVIFDTQPPYNTSSSPYSPGQASQRFYSKEISPKVPTGSYSVAQISYELNVLGTRGPRRMSCIMYSIPASSMDAGSTVPGQPEQIVPRCLGDSFRSISSSTRFSSARFNPSKSITNRSMASTSARFSDNSGGMLGSNEPPLVLRNKAPRWHEQLQCWCLNFRGRVTVASVKNFQLVTAVQPNAGTPLPSQPAQSDHDKIIMQFGKVAKDLFTMDYRQEEQTPIYSLPRRLSQAPLAAPCRSKDTPATSQPPLFTSPTTSPLERHSTTGAGLGERGDNDREKGGFGHERIGWREGDREGHSILRDVRDGFGSLSRRSFEVRVTGLHKGKSQSSVHELCEPLPVILQTCWANLPPELLYDVIKRLEASECTWPSRRYVVACAAVCRSWREMCKEIVRSPELSGKLTFPVSLKQPGPRDGMIQCFIKRDKPKLTYHLYLCLSPAVLVENGKFLLSAKRIRRTTYTEYVISMNADNISRSNNTCIGKIRSNFLGTKFIIYDTQPPYNAASLGHIGRTSRRFYSKKVSPKVPHGNYNIAQVSYELNVLGTRGPRRMHCIMHSIPASALDAGGIVPGQPEHILPRSFEDSFRTMSFSKSIMDRSPDFGSARFSTVAGETIGENGYDEEIKERPLVLRNKAPRWHEQLQCWCLNFRGRVTVASVKNFQLIAANQPAAGAPSPSQPPPTEHDKIILQFGKVANDMFTMDYRYPLSAFQAFAICLSSFDTKLACE